MQTIDRITHEFHLQKWQSENIIQLIEDGNTIPFIARYRKEAHGSLDDQVLREFSDRLSYLNNLEQRREEIFQSIQSLEKMTEEIETALQQAETLAELDDIYRPYRPKRRTRGTIAREKGLEPLAAELMKQEKNAKSPLELAREYIDVEKEVHTPEDAIAGAKDIIAEDISDHPDIRKRLRNLFLATGTVLSKGVTEEDTLYTVYHDFSQEVSQIPGHRILAIDRGEREKMLKIAVAIDSEKALFAIEKETVQPGHSLCTPVVKEAGADAYERLLQPSLEREIRNLLTERAAEDAIRLFAANLKQLFMQPPLKNQVVIGLDPGYRTGCKVAVVDSTGKVLDTGVIYPVPPHNKKEDAKRIIKGMVEKHSATVFAIGNGTATKETELFTAELIQEMPQKALSYLVVSEAGASVYSASKLAAKEFPEFDVSLRSAVSIARRLQDPLAELVKIDPKSIGVGQYQHDMPQKQLEHALNAVVEDCVNSVGVDLNTASAPLLKAVSGINTTVAENIVTFREENGIIPSRAALKNVPKLGPKAFEQCAAFLRVSESKQVLDRTAVHPESYPIAKKLLDACGFSLKEVEQGKLDGLQEAVETIGINTLAEQLEAGVPTLQDIITELRRPGRDPREDLPKPILRSDVLDIKDLKPGMEFQGTVRNVIDFGAFVDIGVHQDGLVHISKLSSRFVKHPREVVKVGDIVTVWVTEIDIERDRIALTMVQPK